MSGLPALALSALSGLDLALPRLTRDLVTALGVASLVVLLGLSGFFSSSEIAMFSLARHRVEALVEDGVRGSKAVAELTRDPHRLLITILVGNNIANIAMSAIATGLFALYVTQGQAVLAATFGVTTLVLLFGESAPKSYAVENAESWALRIARPLKVSETLLLPLVVTFDYLTRVVNSVTGGRSAIETSYVSRQDIRQMIETGEREGVIGEEERAMLQRIFRFTNTIAKEVMTPRLDVVAVDIETSPDAALQECVRSGHDRLPVYRETLDEVVGVVTLGSLVGRPDERDDPTVEELSSPAFFVPESKSVDELLAEMNAERVRMAVVIDEFGTTEGILTMADITDVIVGEMFGNGEEGPITFLTESAALVRGETPIEDVNEVLDIELPDGEEFETLAGYIFNRVGRLVEQGEEFVYDGVRFRIERVERTRIREVLVSTDAVEPDAESAGAAG